MPKVSVLRKNLSSKDGNIPEQRDVREEPCQICGRPTLGWGITRTGRLCGRECEEIYKRKRFSDDNHDNH